jgi:hypothetical protein
MVLVVKVILSLPRQLSCSLGIGRRHVRWHSSPSDTESVVVKILRRDIRWKYR